MKLPLSQSLRFRFPLYVILGVVSPILVGITWMNSRARDAIAIDTAASLSLEAKSLANTVEQWTRMNVLAIQNLSKQSDIVSFDPQRQTKALKTITDTYPHIYTASTVDSLGNNIARSDGRALQNYSDRLWFQGAMAGNDIIYQSIKRTSKQPAVCFSTPINRLESSDTELSIAGVVMMCSALAEIVRQVKATTVGNTGYAMVVDEKGRVIARSDADITEDMTEDGLENLSNFAPVKNLLTVNEESFTFEDETGKTWLSEGERLQNGWSVLVLQTANEAYTPLKQLQRLNVLIGAFTILFAGGITWLLAERSLEPIQKMTIVAERMSQGDLESRISISSQDELAILANTLNTMARQLQEAFAQLATQYEDRTTQLLDDRETSQQQLQQKIPSLQQEIAPVSERDLTAMAAVTEDEIDAVADSYDRTLDNLGKIILQIREVTRTVTDTTNRNEAEVARLSADALAQTQEISSVLEQMRKTAQSMSAVADSAAKAEDSIKQAKEEVEKGDSVINATVERIISLGESTAIAKEQVQKLGKASRKISKAVDLIRKIALQTNVLAVNASIEAARAGEEGMGFTVVADEVQSLAARSAKTATDIEKLVLEIQGETQKAIKAMEQNSQEINAGSQLMQQTRLSLQQVTKASSELDLSIENITKVAAEQSKQTHAFTDSMTKVAAVANKTSNSANNVSTSFKELIQVAEQLEASVNRFEVE